MNPDDATNLYIAGQEARDEEIDRLERDESLTYEEAVRRYENNVKRDPYYYDVEED